MTAVLYMRVQEPGKAVIGVENCLYATSQLAQTTLRSVLGETELDELLMNREKINDILKTIIEQRTEEWGVEVSAVEIKDVDLPPEMKRAMARQAEAPLPDGRWVIPEWGPSGIAGARGATGASSAR